MRSQSISMCPLAHGILDFDDSGNRGKLGGWNPNDCSQSAHPEASAPLCMLAVDTCLAIYGGRNSN